MFACNCLIPLSDERWQDERDRAVLDLLHHDPNRTNRWWTNRTLCEYRVKYTGSRLQRVKAYSHQQKVEMKAKRSKNKRTRLHSSRMHTARLLTVSSSMHYAAGGWSAPRGVLSALGDGGVCSRGVSAPQEVCCSRGGGGIPACTEADPPPPVDRILDTCYWKYYLAPNFVCGF